MVQSLNKGHRKLTTHTTSLAAGAQPAPASIEAMAWLAGHWKGEALGGISEEFWSPPLGGAMMGMYRLVKDDKPVFYELMNLSEVEASLILRLKHFNPNMAGWEEKEKTVDFRYVTKDSENIYFDGLTFYPEGPDSVRMYLAIGGKDGNVREEEFRYRRQ